MFLGVVLFVILCQVKGDLDYKCREGENATVKIVPAAGGIQGRYTVELCILRNPNATEWEINLWYYKNVKDCKDMIKRRSPFIHSVSKEDLEPHNISCKNVTCFSTDFDLVFAGCYNIYSVFKSGSRTLLTTNNNKFTIKNNMTLEGFANNQPRIIYIPNNEYILLRWIVGIPVSKPFILDLWRSKDKVKENIPNISDNCTLSESTYEVVCKLVVPQGCYIAKLQHNPLWSSVLNTKTEITYPFCLEQAGRVVVTGGGADGGWRAGRGVAAGCGAALLVAAALLGAALARRGLLTRNFHKRVLEGWRLATQRGRESESSRCGIVAAPSTPRPCRVLLLHAREGECGARAVRPLADLLRRYCGEVLDLYSPEVMALAGAAPGAWLRAALACPDTRVLLLQTPALAALYTTHVDRTNLNLLEPLLGRRAMYRAPAFGDQLLPLALRLLAEGLAAHHDYRKYYFATYGLLETDVLPAVVPFRRYVLPAATHALLRDLSPAHETHDAHKSHNVQDTHDIEVDVTLINHFESAVNDFVIHVQENQDYLMEDLMII